MYWLFTCMVYIAALVATSGDNKKLSANEYDTYNPECPRIRKGWHTLSDAERDLYVSGLLKLRENGEQDMDKDEVIAIGSVHADIYAPFIHKTSSYLYWHGYLTWELESRIRNLGGKYACFGMPYWDFTMEAGNEENPSIFGTGLGGDGDPDNFHNVNGYSWPFTREQYWTPTDCYTETDEYPICSLKRALRENFQMPSAKSIGENIINNPNFVDFASYSHISGQAVHLIDGDDTYKVDGSGDKMYEFTQSYEPIWYLFHSMIQYHQAIWTDCNEYDQIALDELDKYPQAFSAFCNSYDTCTVNNNGYPQKWLQWELDDPMHFGGKLIKHEWSFINKQVLTVRKLYNLPKWNIIYDLGNGDGFYTDAGLKDYCDGRLNDSWFILNDDEGHDDVLVNKVRISSLLWSDSNNIHIFAIIFGAILSMICGLYYFGRYIMKKQYEYDQIAGGQQHDDSLYGSMKSIAVH